MSSEHPSQQSEHPERHEFEQDQAAERPAAPQVPLDLPEISTGPDLADFLNSAITSSGTPVADKRASNVAKLAQENAKLNDELRAMTERIEAAERKRAELEGARKARDQKQQFALEPPSS